MKKNFVEWSVFAFGLAVLLGLAGFLATEALGDRRPARLTAEVEEPRQAAGDRWEVPVTVSNTGSEAASAVTVRAKAGDQAAEFDLEHLPGGARRRGLLGFDAEPKGLKVTVTGAETP